MRRVAILCLALAILGAAGPASAQVDATPPPGPQPLSPADGSVWPSAVLLEWERVTDVGGGAVPVFYAVLDGERIQPERFDPCYKQVTNCTEAVARAGAGTHEWWAVACDEAGNCARGPSRTFTIKPKLSATLGLDTPVPVLTGQPVRFVASAAYSATGVDEPPLFSYDFDGDGTVDLGPTTETSVSHAYAAPGTYTARVDVTGGMDTSATATTAPFEVRLAPPEGRVGITIDDGAQFTNSRDVTISPIWPAFSLRTVLSNDGGFAMPTSAPVAATIPWRLESAGSERVPRIVYARFEQGPYDLPGAAPTYTDDIVLDTAAPRLTKVKAKRRSRGLFRVTLKAADEVSGVEAMQVRRSGTFVPFKRRSDVRGRWGSAVPVRLRDVAGNVSAWRKIRLPKRS